MAILAECPICRKKQSVKNKRCNCGQNMDSASLYFKPVLITAFNTGMRQKELQKLQWKHIDREEMFIRLPGEITKTDYPRDIPFNHHVKAVLDDLPRAIAHDYVFTHRGKPFTHGLRFLNQIQKTCEDAGVPYGGKSEEGITMRDIRRTVKTNMLSAGVNPVYRDLILGHSLKGMDRHYLSPSRDTLKEAMAKFTDWLDMQLENVDKALTMRGYQINNFSVLRWLYDGEIISMI